MNAPRTDEDAFADRDDESWIERLSLLDRWSCVRSLRAMAARRRFSTPFDSLNGALGLGGWCGGNAYVLVGGTGAGKTSLALGLARFHALEHGPVIYVSEEMEEGHCLARGGAATLGTYANSLIIGNHDLTDDQLAEGLPPSFFLQRGQSLEKLRAAALGVAQRFNTPPLIVVDYLGKVVASMLRRDPQLDPRIATTFASSEIVAIAHAAGCPILVVAAGGRGSLMKLRPGAAGRPKSVRDLPPSELVDIAKESGDVEYDATAMLTLSVSEEEDCDGFQVATLTVAKSRHGKAQHIKMAYDGPRGQWHDRGPHDRKAESESKTNGASASDTMSAEYIARLNMLGGLVVEMLKAGPRSRTTIADTLRKVGKVKFRNEELWEAIAALAHQGVLAERGSARASRVYLVGSELPGTSAEAS